LIWLILGYLYTGCLEINGRIFVSG